MTAFFIGCGLTHLFKAYATFDPIYRFMACFEVLNGLVSMAGSAAIAVALVQAFSVVRAKRKRLEELEAKALAARLEA